MRRAVAALAMLGLLTALGPSPSGARSGDGGALQAPASLLRLKAGHVDPVEVMQAGPRVPAGEKALYVVQFRHRVTPGSRDLLRARGADVGGYLPENAYLVRMTAKQAEGLAGEAGIRAVARYLPAWKAPDLSGAGAALPTGGASLPTGGAEAPSRSGEARPAPDEAGRQAQEAPDLRVEAFPGAEEEMVAAAKALGATEIRPGRGGATLRLPLERVADLVRSEAVVYVEPVRPVRLRNDVASGLVSISGSAEVWASGLSGEGQRVGVADTGLDTGNTATLHADLAPNLALAIARGRPGDWSDPDGHGTHVAGSVVGNGAHSAGQIRGMAPAGELVFQSVLDAGGGLGGIGDAYDLLAEAYAVGARIHSNSWGVPYEWGGWTYDAMARNFDQFIWDHKDMTVLVAAGNDGDVYGSPTYDTVSTPATAKNILSVGATENDRPDRSIYADNPDEVAFFSSRGNTPDGRVKPDVVAPGTWILSTKSSLVPPWPPGYDLVGPYNDHYEFMSGTSMATPVTAGAAALVRQYFEEVRHIAPAASLIKAALINGADDLGDGWMSKDQGWGRINLANTLYPADGRVNWYENEANALVQDEVREYSFWVESGQILKATLVWSDPPPSIGAVDEILINDLDLIVIGPDGTDYPGNCFLGDRTTSAPGCAPDAVNNVENVYIAAPEAGLYTVRVRAAAAVPDFSPQPYSLAVSGKGLSSGGAVDCAAEGEAMGTHPQPLGLNPAKEAERSPAIQSVQAIGNPCAEARIGEDGRFNFGLYQPTGDFWYNTSYYWPVDPWSSFTTVRVDGQDGVYGSGGNFVQPPTNEDANTNVSVWQYGEVSVRQTIAIAQNPATGQPDAAAIRYTLTNTGASAHEVGLRIMIDTMLNDNDGAPFRVPGSGGAMEAVTEEREYLGAAVPDFWQAFEDLANPEVAAQMTLRGADATPPDRLAIASWGGIWNTLWDYPVDPQQPVTWDSAVGMWWNPISLAPGETRTIVVYYGRPQVAATRMLTLSCPASLDADEWSAQPFQVAAYFTNTTGAPYPGVTLELETPLAILDGADRSLGDLDPGASGSASWSLQPMSAGTYPIAMRAWQEIDGRRVLVDRADCTVVAEEPAVPENITFKGIAGFDEHGNPVGFLCGFLVVNADYSGQPVTGVTLTATDAAGHHYTAVMSSIDPGHWYHGFYPCQVGLTSSPVAVVLMATLADGSTFEQRFDLILIDPSGFIFNQAMGEGWRLPEATVSLQYFDPLLQTWVTLTEQAYPGAFSPVTNPQITGVEGWYGWDAIAGDYRVQVSRPGFAPATSPVVTIPPPVTDLNVGLVPTDATAPVATAEQWPNEPTHITLAATDDHADSAGVRYIAYTLDGGQEMRLGPNGAVLIIVQGGIHHLTYWAVDHAGNQSAQQTLTFTIGEGCEETAPSLAWLPPLSDTTSAAIGAGETLPIRFRWAQCGIHVRDESVTVRIRNAQTGQLIAGFTYGHEIWIDDAAGEYGQDFLPAQYNIPPGTQLKVMVYFGSRLKGTALVDVE